MPQHTERSRLRDKDLKREKATNKGKRPARLEVTVIADPKVKGIGYLTRPVHMPDPADKRLPGREADYIHHARPNGRPETEQEALIRRLHRDGFTLERIAVNTGVKLEAIFDLLGLDRTTQEFKEIKAKLQARKRV